MMDRRVKLQDQITALRAPAGVLGLFFGIIFGFFILFTAPSLQLAWNAMRIGEVASFETLAADGLASHHFQAVNLNGWATYDQRLDLIGEHNTVEDRFVTLQDEDTHLALLVKINRLYAIREAEQVQVRGVLRKMSPEKLEAFTQTYGAQIAELQTQGWQLDLQYYINEDESLPRREDIRGMLIFAAVNSALILLCLIPYLVPHPKTLPPQTH